jgi:hypothetical protein
MEAYTLNRQFQRVEVIDAFESFIWTERYYGDSDCQLVVPATKESLARFPVGTFLEHEDSQEIMILEIGDMEDGKATITGTSLLKWMNNRFTRATSAMADRYYNIPANFMGVPQMLWQIFSYIVISPGPDGIPVPYRARLLIPNIVLKSYDEGPPYPGAAVPYGPLYDALREIAEAYQVGMSLTLEEVTDSGYTLGFRSYRGKDRTSAQTTYPPVQFSPDMDSLTDIKELVSIADYKTEAWVFVPSNPGGLGTTSGPGYAAVDGGAGATGFDLRAIMVFADDITTDLVGGSASAFKAQLDQRAKSALGEHPYVAHIDGEIVPTSQFNYGIDYQLGDVIEIAGPSGVVQNARITEYIRSHDASGEKAYPTVTMIT